MYTKDSYIIMIETYTHSYSIPDINHAKYIYAIVTDYSYRFDDLGKVIPCITAEAYLHCDPDHQSYQSYTHLHPKYRRLDLSVYSIDPKSNLYYQTDTQFTKGDDIIIYQLDTPSSSSVDHATSLTQYCIVNLQRKDRHVPEPRLHTCPVCHQPLTTFNDSHYPYYCFNRNCRAQLRKNTTNLLSSIVGPLPLQCLFLLYTHIARARFVPISEVLNLRPNSLVDQDDPVSERISAVLAECIHQSMYNVTLNQILYGLHIPTLSQHSCDLIAKHLGVDRVPLYTLSDTVLETLATSVCILAQDDEVYLSDTELHYIDWSVYDSFFTYKDNTYLVYDIIHNVLKL